MRYVKCFPRNHNAWIQEDVLVAPPERQGHHGNGRNLGGVGLGGRHANLAAWRAQGRDNVQVDALLFCRSPCNSTYDFACKQIHWFPINGQSTPCRGLLAACGVAQTGLMCAAVCKAKKKRRPPQPKLLAVATSQVSCNWEPRHTAPPPPTRVDVHAAVCRPRDCGAHSVGHSHAQRASRFGILQGSQGVGCLARLQNNRH